MGTYMDTDMLFRYSLFSRSERKTPREIRWQDGKGARYCEKSIRLFFFCKNRQTLQNRTGYLMGASKAQGLKSSHSRPIYILVQCSTGTHMLLAVTKMLNKRG